jgi:histidinol-phosphate aminotransferase
MALDLIREHIRGLDPYKPIIPLKVLSEQMGQPIERLIKLDANENPYGMPPSALKRLANLRYGHIYPDPESRQIRQRLSEYLQLPFENILVGAGADELIDLIARLTMDPGDKVIDCPPTFGFYVAIAQINNLCYVPIHRNKDFSLNVEEIKSAAKNGAKLIFLANPNNPDGSLIPLKTIKMLLDLPLLVVIDEAYIEFSPPNSSFVQEVLHRDNLIVLRTFSKWGGLAGLRLGYGVFPAKIVQQILKIKQPYNVSEAASEAGLGALEDLELLNQRSAWIIGERQRLFNALLEFDWLSPYPTQANFILTRVVDRDAQQLKLNLANKGILIRYFNKPGLEDHVRFSIGTSEQTDRLIAALKELET